MKKTTTKAKAFAALKRASKMVGESNYPDYYSVSTGVTNTGGWYVSTSFLCEKGNGEKEHVNFFLYSYATKEDYEKFYTDLANFLSKF